MDNEGFANFSVGNACNLRCKFCYNDQGRFTKQYFLDKNDAFKIIDKLRKDTNGINLIGGEPLMHPDIFILLDYIKELKFTKIRIVTNGMKFTDENFTKRLLQDYKIKSISVSIHSHKNDLENEITQRKSVLEKKIEGLDKLFFVKKELTSDVLVGINITINNINVNYLSDTINFYYERYGKDIAHIGISGMILIDDISNDNSSTFVRYSDIIKNLSKVKRLEGVKFLANWIPLCIHSQISNRFYLIRELTPEYINSIKDDGRSLIRSHDDYKLSSQKCIKCHAYLRYCSGIYNNYFEKYGDEEFKILTQEDVKVLFNTNINKM